MSFLSRISKNIRLRIVYIDMYNLEFLDDSDRYTVERLDGEFEDVIELKAFTGSRQRDKCMQWE